MRNMRDSRARRAVAPIAAAILLGACWTSARAGIIKTMDRPFPTGLFCPAESRAAAGADLSFVAPAATVRITFSGDNQDGSGNWNGFRVDNVAVVLKSVFDARQVSPSPGFESCYDTTPPPGHATGGLPNAPSYDFNAASTPEVFLDLFPSTVSGWSGSHHYFDSTRTSPTAPASGTGFTGGSLGLGLITDGQVPVSASRIVTGLTPGQVYVLTLWWYAIQTSPLTLTIGVPCADLDADGAVVCGACDPQPGETCGDCDDNNARCGTDCTDQDADGWCVTTDCYDGAATCTNNCAPDVDTDGLSDCRDGCLDQDRDGYGTAGGGGNTCLGADCAPANQWCNVSCVDADSDGHCVPGDCQDTNPNVANGLAEVNDYFDQNCPGDAGYGVADEISGDTGFLTPGSNTIYSWPPQPGASSYLAARSSSKTFPPVCTTLTTSSTSWTDTGTPAPGGMFTYLVRPLTTAKGSWGQNSAGQERAAVCGQESNCGNSLDDDADLAVDCADADCANTAGCRAATFAFTDTENDDIADDALWQFFQSTPAGASDFIFFEIVASGRTLAWCSENAAFYRAQYMVLASTQGTVSSGAWNRWARSPSSGNAWSGPSQTPHLNTYGDDCFGFYSWCSEQYPVEPQNSIFPNRVNDCEVFDLTSGSCGASVGGTWQLTLKVASSRALACGF